MVKKLIMKNGICTGLFCILAILASFVISSVTCEVFVYFSVEERLAETIGRFVASTCILLFYHKVFGLLSFGIRRENFLKGLVIGGFLFFVTIGNIVIYVMGASEYPVVMPSIKLVMLVVAEQIFVGIFEEFLFRGLILNVLLEKMKDRQWKGILMAVFISSALFGAIHFLNLQDSPDLVNATISQSLGAMCIGVFFAALYLRTQNIWVVAFYHTISNLAGDLTEVFFKIPEGISTDITLSEVLVNVLANSVLIFIGLFIARKLKKERTEVSVST